MNQEKVENRLRELCEQVAIRVLTDKEIVERDSLEWLLKNYFAEGKSVDELRKETDRFYHLWRKCEGGKGTDKDEEILNLEFHTQASKEIFNHIRYRYKLLDKLSL